MLSKKPALVVASYASCPPSFCLTPSPPGTSCRHTLVQKRKYAQHVSESASGPRLHSHSQPSCHDTDVAWPAAIHPHKTPTPYQILSQKPGQRYTKHRFYALAKLYHPDRCGHASSPVCHLPHAVCVERYRQLVAAHTILSDDTKRRAYDLWGSGWTGHHHSPSPDAPFEWRPEAKAWPAGHDPQYNATWEDWERWYQREYQTGPKGQQRETYMSTFSFMSLIFALVTLGGIVQGTRANNLATSVMENRDRIHKEASMELARSKRATLTGDRNERIRTFLEHREANMAVYEAEERLLPATEHGAPDSIRKQ